MLHYSLAAFSAYVCRPTAALFIAIFGIHLLFSNRKCFIQFSFAIAVLFICFVFFSFRQYGASLPPYYLPAKVASSGNFLMGIYGILLSPSRGLFIFSPQLALILITISYFWREWVKMPLIPLMFAWILLHWIIIARWECWWGGASFGPRLLTDSLPAFVILGAQCVNLIQNTNHRKARTLFISGFAILSVWALFVNTVQGLYNPRTSLWNFIAPKKPEPAVYFEWKAPQFLP